MWRKQHLKLQRRPVNGWRCYLFGFMIMVDKATPSSVDVFCVSEVTVMVM